MIHVIAIMNKFLLELILSTDNVHLPRVSIIKSCSFIRIKICYNVNNCCIENRILVISIKIIYSADCELKMSIAHLIRPVSKCLKRHIALLYDG